ncbi:uncharacterized protein B0H18DRAFT_410231 [Fomitopsis serialis]|uniref:uncharacterized protein n=1 Tax=Fomitopsis serialis TaxID=139415 RepID=UPI002008D4BD|nr:uncharacterized protein B0H18DRAFT_410231 [Neoantrodia serialis]KAH9935320.1 hypothetical protein B0H18DRAFT_410231 [Neoantrodia serialis]
MLKFPLDYLSDSKDTRTASIALQILLAWPQKPRKCKGLPAILLGLGGLGVPGTSSVNRWGNYVTDIVDPDYNVLGFDQRGTGPARRRRSASQVLLGLRADKD